jgi:hypothetical protein
LTVENVENTEGSRKKWGLYEKFYNISEWLKTIDSKECQHFYENPFRLEKQTLTDHSMNQNLLSASKTSLIESSLNFSQLQASMPDVQPVIIKREEQTPSSIPIRAFSAKKFQIDPFENRKNALLKNRISRKSDSRSYVDHEMTEKQTLVDRKDYSQLLHVDKTFNLGKLSKEISPAESNDSAAKPQTKLAKLDTKKSYACVNTQTKKLQLESKSTLSVVGQNLRKQKSMNDLLLTRMELDLFIF